ncbi:AraC family transcriptional regulator [Paludibacterium purpuratum]|uniref:AraC family transcriptional regulator n=1 Tax=Paludibacterium purpuratum TaxID=1144873 RepID=A0A4R7BGM3_9NEIS|nr:helix-turn-helix transcriptional regulator [Paludibacterium purpuratum]TDR82917.1 AraC family transcriptional regulator [Paludibacterium purpuratum]
MTALSEHVGDLSAWALSREYAPGQTVGPHAHAEGQLIVSIGGAMSLQCGDRLWLLPPQRGVWMPPGRVHCMRARGAVSLRTLYVMPDSRYLARLPTEPRALTVSALLRELILRLVRTERVRCSDEREQRVMQLLVDELSWSDDLGLPMPVDADERLSRVCLQLVADPADGRDLETLGVAVGASGRTLSRLFADELGMSYQLWRQHLSVMTALPRLAAGEPVSVVALDLGYDNPGAFAAMFRRLMQQAPSEYARQFAG